jgi:hypothetical protein
MIGLGISLTLLWILIALFNKSGHPELDQREAQIVVMGVAIVGIIAWLLFGRIFRPAPALLQLVALFILVERVCETDRPTTIRICGYYLLVLFVLHFILRLLTMRPVRHVFYEVLSQFNANA